MDESSGNDRPCQGARTVEQGCADRNRERDEGLYFCTGTTLCRRHRLRIGQVQATCALDCFLQVNESLVLANARLRGMLKAVGGRSMRRSGSNGGFQKGIPGTTFEFRFTSGLFVQCSRMYPREATVCHACRQTAPQSVALGIVDSQKWSTWKHCRWCGWCGSEYLRPGWHHSSDECDVGLCLSPLSPLLCSTGRPPTCALGVHHLWLI